MSLLASPHLSNPILLPKPDVLRNRNYEILNMSFVKKGLSTTTLYSTMTVPHESTVQQYSFDWFKKDYNACTDLQTNQLDMRRLVQFKTIRIIVNLNFGL